MQSAQARTAAASTSTSSVGGRILPYSFYLFSLFTSSLLIVPLPSLLNSSSLILSLTANLFPIDAPLHATTYRCVYFFFFVFFCKCTRSRQPIQGVFFLLLLLFSSVSFTFFVIVTSIIIIIIVSQVVSF